MGMGMNRTRTTNAAQRSVPNCAGWRYPFVTHELRICAAMIARVLPSTAAALSRALPGVRARDIAGDEAMRSVRAELHAVRSCMGCRRGSCPVHCAPSCSAHFTARVAGIDGEQCHDFSAR